MRKKFRAMRMARAARRAEPKSAPPAVTKLSPIATKADDLEAIRKAVEDAAAISGGLWLSYLFVLSYIAVAAGAVTHTDLFLRRPVRMPFLNVELPLLSFFAFAPLIVIITHAYTLVHFAMLGRKASRFNEELRRQFPDTETETLQNGATRESAPKEVRDKLRRLLPSNIFVQVVAGPPELRRGVFGLILKTIAWTTLAFFPVLLLLLLQTQFLPYHDVSITNAQRVALIVDIALLWVLRPPILSDRREKSAARSDLPALATRGLSLVVAGLMSIATVWLSVLILTIPGEWQEQGIAWLDPRVWRVTSSNPLEEGAPKAETVSMHELLFSGRTNPRTFQPESLFWNVLVLPDFDVYQAQNIDDPNKISWKKYLVDLRFRHLEKAVLWRANLAKADFSGAWLQGASFENARLQGASFDFAELQGASLFGARLQEVSLLGANLQGAYLDHAQFQGASLKFAILLGASLQAAWLQGASLDIADCRGASFDEAQLQGASLYKADLQGASLNGAQLQGASIADAQLQGASLDHANLNATELSGSFLWRTTWQRGSARIATIRLQDVKWEPVWIEATHPFSAPIPWTGESYTDLQRLVERVPATEMLPAAMQSEMRAAALQRLVTLDCDNLDKTLAPCDPAALLPPEAQDLRTTLEKVVVDDAAFARALIATWRELLCAGDNDTIHILRGILHPRMIAGSTLGNSYDVPAWRLLKTDGEAPTFVNAVMSKDCPLSELLTDDDKNLLLLIKGRSEK
jgi:uncharacterized protein YjbI with pentapeptide repeats